MKLLIHIAAVFLLLATGATCLSGCNAKPLVSAPAPTVKVVNVIQADVPIYQESLSILDGLASAQIRSQVNGYLVAQNYREGESVKQGDLLFEIDPRPLEVALEQANAVLAEAEARFGQTERTVKRYGPFLTNNVISEKEYDDAVQADLAAKAVVFFAKAQVEQAEANMGLSKITSPIDGIPRRAKAHIGDMVGPTTGELTTVSTVNPIKASFNVAEEAYASFTNSTAVESGRAAPPQQPEIQLLLTDGVAYPQNGSIYAVTRPIGSTKGLLRVEALFPNPSEALRPGEYVRVRLKVATKHNALLVPRRAVSESQSGSSVAIVGNDTKIHIQPVRVGEQSGDMYIIESGVCAGQRVAVDGVENTVDGMAVTATILAVEPVTLSASRAPTQ